MRPAIIILLAVCSNLIEAGPVRHHGRFVQRDLNPRFTNGSAVFTTSDAPPTSTPISKSSTSTSSATDAPASSSSPSSQSSTIFAQSQLASISAFGDGSIAATPMSTNIAKAVTSTAAIESLTQSTPSFVAPPVIGSDGVASQMSASQAASGLSKTIANTASNVQASLSDTLNAQTTSASASVSSASSQAAVVQIPAKNTFEFSPVTTTSSAPKPSSTIQYPNAQNGNSAMASGFNQIYKTLQMTSSCDASDNNQAFACISGEIAQCQSDGTYVLKSCPMGQSCYALPLSGKTGVSVECAVPSDAAARLAAQPSSASPNTMAASQAPSTIQQPANSPNAESVSQVASTTQSLSSGSLAVLSTSSPEPQPTISRQGVGLVAGGINTPPTNTPPTSTMQQQAQTAASSPSATAEQQSQSNSIASQTAATFSTASVAKQSQSQVMISQGEAPIPTASRSPDAQVAEQSLSQAALEASATRQTVAPARTSQAPDFNAIAQPSLQSTSETSPTFQPVATTSQSVAPTMASQNDNNQPHDQSAFPKSASQAFPVPQASQNANATPADQSPPKVTTSSEASPTAGGVGGFIFTPIGQQPSASSTPQPHRQHQANSADNSAPTSTPQPPAQAQELPAAAKDTQPSPTAQSNQASSQAAQAPTPAPSAPGGQFSIIPMGPGNSDKNNNNNNNNNPDNKPPSSGNAATNEKLVVNPGGSAPVYITVTTTVTTTAYTAAPSA